MGSLDELAGIHTGELDVVSNIMGQLKVLDSFITSYVNNRYALPSTSLALPKQLEHARLKYRDVVTFELKIAEIDLKLKEAHFNLTRNPNMAFELNPYIANLEMHLADNVASAKVKIDQMKFVLREFQNIFVCEFALVQSGIDIMDERQRFENLKKDGISYSIDFKLISKNELLNINKSKEVPSNETNRGKSSG